MITIQLLYLSQGIRVMRRGAFQRRGRISEKVALDWIYEIKKEMDVDSVVEVIVDGNQNITEEVNKIIKAPLN